MAAIGRPSKFTPEIADAICEWIAGGKTLRDFCRQEGTPSFQTVYRWIAANPELSRRFDVARETGADAIAQDVLDIIDTEPEVAITKGGSNRDMAHVVWLRNRAELRLKLLAKWYPQRYGDKLEVGGKVEHTHTHLEALEAARARAADRQKTEATQH